jgi:hypothetical protein
MTAIFSLDLEFYSYERGRYTLVLCNIFAPHLTAPNKTAFRALGFHDCPYPRPWVGLIIVMFQTSSLAFGDNLEGWERKDCHEGLLCGLEERSASLRSGVCGSMLSCEIFDNRVSKWSNRAYTLAL